MPVLGAAVTLRSPGEIVENIRKISGGAKWLRRIAGVSALAASVGALAAAKQGDERELVQTRRTRVFFKRQIKAEFRQSRLTGFLNRRDLPFGFGDRVVASDGDVIGVTGRGTWHRGTTVVKTPGGKERTITHIQSLGLPATHYYFDRPLSDREAAGIISGQRAYRPHKLPGYAGEVNRMEYLAPTWALAKHAMIKTRLYRPTSPAKWVEQEKKL
jgi:hypothetical protein